MSDRPDLVRAARLWVRLAEGDIRNAEHALTLGEECPFETVGFHAQQCAEKYLKALLVMEGREPPRTHNLIAVLDQLALQVGGNFSIDDLADLTPFAVEGRYPGDFEPVGRDEAEAAVAAARRVRDSARKALPPSALQIS